MADPDESSRGLGSSARPHAPGRTASAFLDPPPDDPANRESRIQKEMVEFFQTRQTDHTSSPFFKGIGTYTHAESKNTQYEFPHQRYQKKPPVFIPAGGPSRIRRNRAGPELQNGVQQTYEVLKQALEKEERYADADPSTRYQALPFATESRSNTARDHDGDVVMTGAEEDRNHEVQNPGPKVKRYGGNPPSWGRGKRPVPAGNFVDASRDPRRQGRGGE